MTAAAEMPLNQAAWLRSKQERPFSVSSAPFPTPGPEHLIVQVRAAAINPADAIIQASGLVLTEDQYPAILGFDVAGIIHSVGSQVTSKYPHFKIGDRIMAGADASPQYRGFQSYCAVPASTACHIPATTSFTDASVLPIAICTAGVALFQSSPGLGLSLPTSPASPPNGSTLLIWGGSSSVGSCGIQLAVAAGYEVLTTASAHNHALCTSIGATHVFDHTRADVVDTILSTLQRSGKPFAGAMTAIMTDDVHHLCAELVSRVPGGRQHVATMLPGPHMPLPTDIPEGVEMTYTQCTDLKDLAIGRDIWGSWAPKALAAGELKCMPPARVVGKGLESVQEACDVMINGVSGTKLVVELV